MTDVLARLDQARGECSVLEHPFYERWSAGELSAAELARYAGEYRHAVVALAEASRAAAAKAGPAHASGLRRHAAEETAHVELWDDFARATVAQAEDTVDGDDGPAAVSAPAPRRRSRRRRRARGRGRRARICSSTWRCSTRSRPASRRSRRRSSRASTEHYGYSEEGPALEYFKVHELRDVEHAREAGALIEELLAGTTSPRRRPSGCSHGRARRCRGTGTC